MLAKLFLFYYNYQQAADANRRMRLVFNSKLYKGMLYV